MFRRIDKFSTKFLLGESVKSFREFLRENSSFVSEASNDGEKIIVSNKTQLRKLIDDFSLSLDKIIIAKNHTQYKYCLAKIAFVSGADLW